MIVLCVVQWPQGTSQTEMKQVLASMEFQDTLGECIISAIVGAYMSELIKTGHRVKPEATPRRNDIPSDAIIFIQEDALR